MPEKSVVVYNVLWVCVWSYVGVSGRVGLSALSKSSSSLSFMGAGYFLPNIFGSFVMGLIAGVQSTGNPFPHLFIGLSTGFCGCCTTFATWQYEVGKELLSGDPFLALLHLLTTFTASFLALRSGKHLGNFLSAYYCPEKSEEMGVGVGVGLRALEAEKDSGEPESQQHSLPDLNINNVLCGTQPLPLAAVFLLVTVVVWTLALVPSVPSEGHKWFVPILFAPLGATGRYLLSLRNPDHPKFPLFTFIPNVLASVINVFLGMVLGSKEVLHISSEGAIWVGKGLSTGWMGSLSTVSTWVNELDKLSNGKLKWAYIYGIASVSVTQLLVLFVGGLWILAGNTF